MKKVKKLGKLFLKSLILFLCIFLFSSLINTLDLLEQNKKNELIDTNVEDVEKQDSNLEKNKIVEATINDNNSDSNNINNDYKYMKVHYIDVGNGDSIFIELPNNTNMLIDAGESSKGDKVVDYIKSLGYSNINYVIGTHPHTDHIGGLSKVINSFTIEKIYMPKVISTSKTYENLLNTIMNKGLKIQTARAGIDIINSQGLLITLLAPNNDLYSDLNNYSVVIKIEYQDVKFLFMGDAEEKSENEILCDVESDVIKVGHHGSNTSSSKKFVSRVNAKYAIISVGSDNNYNHPNIDIVNRWKDANAKVYRTDENGTIVVSTNGSTLNVEKEK